MEHERLCADLARRLGHEFADPSLLVRALTHRSFTADNNERLEFLGDALISVVIAELLFRQRPKESEGALSRLRSSLVRERALAGVARRLDLGEALLIGEGERKSGGWRRDSVLADALEAVIAAVYLDSGFGQVSKVCHALFAPELKNLPDAESLKDAKTRLQEWLQARNRPLPIYEVISESGPAHRRSFSVRATVADTDGEALATAASRRTAEQQAARVLLAQLTDADAS